MAQLHFAKRIDEAYLDVSSCGTFEAGLALRRAIQDRVDREEGLSCSVGVAGSKLVAKIASDHRKPHGVTVVIDSRVQEFLDPKSVGALRGVGPKTKEHLAAMGFETVAQLRQCPEDRLAAEFGKFGSHLWSSDTDDIALARATLLSCVEHVRQDLLDEACFGRTLTVKVRFEGYETHSRQTTLKLPTAGRAVLESAALSLAEPFLEARRKIRLVGFSVSKLSPPEELVPLEEAG